MQSHQVSGYKTVRLLFLRAGAGPVLRLAEGEWDEMQCEGRRLEEPPARPARRRSDGAQGSGTAPGPGAGAETHCDRDRAQVRRERLLGAAHHQGIPGRDHRQRRPEDGAALPGGVPVGIEIRQEGGRRGGSRASLVRVRPSPTLSPLRPPVLKGANHCVRSQRTEVAFPATKPCSN